MPYLHSLSIQHFRGIQEFKTTFGRCHCALIIGRGDSGKTTILKAISLLLSPVWNTTFTDLDFYNRDIDTPILIEGVIGDVPKELLTLGKFGEYFQILKGNNLSPDIMDENADQSEKVLKIRLYVDYSLEPSWTIISDREVGDKPISQSDRALFNMLMISDFVDNHFAYSKGSPLYNHLKRGLDKNNNKAPEQKLIELVRSAYENIKDSNEFAEFSEATQIILAQAKKFGLTIEDLQAILEFKNNVYSESGITLHSSDIPFRLHGKGAKRLLSMAIQSGLTDNNSIILIDEIEQGLEPDRIRNLMRILARSNKNQIFITTHSKDAVLEPVCTQIFLMRKGSDRLQTFSDDLQGVLRSQPQAFFAKRIISCEGATEEGIIRAISDNLQVTRGYGIAVQGIVHIDGSGSNKFYDFGLKFTSIGYPTMIFCDDDNREVDKYKQKAIEAKLTIVLCDKGNSIENQLFNDLPWPGIIELLDYAITERPDIHMFPIPGYEDLKCLNDIQNISQDKQPQLRVFLGNKAKNFAWFKNIHHGEFLGRIWIKYLPELDANSTLKKEYNEIITWIGNDIN